MGIQKSSLLLQPEEAEVADDEAEGKRRLSDDKKKKKEKKAKKSKSKHAEAIDDLVTVEQELAVTASTAHRPLCSDEALAVGYDIMLAAENENKVVVSLLLRNQAQDSISKMEISIVESMNAKVVGGGDAIKVPFELAVGTANEHKIFFVMKSISMPQKLRGSLTYMASDW